MPKILVARRPPREQITAGILDAAVSLFAKRGYEATTMQHIAAKVGMTAPALYYYFDSKQRLLFEVIELSLDRFDQGLGHVLEAATGSAADQLRAFVRAHLEFQLEKVERARIYNAMFLGTGALLDALTPRQRAVILRLQSRVRARLNDILERGAAQKEFALLDPTVTAMGILAMGEFAASWFAPGGRLSAALVAEQYACLALRMVRPPAEPPDPITMHS